MDRVDFRLRARREMVAAVLRLAGELSPEDRELIRAVYDNGCSVGRVVTATGARQAPAVRRRVRRIVRRVLSARFRFILRNRARWTPSIRRVATACLIHGRTVRRAAAELGMSHHQVRRCRAAAEALCTAAGV